MWKSTLRKLIKLGRLEVIGPDGRSIILGGMPYRDWQRSLDVVVRLKGYATPMKLAMNPHRFLGEAYMDGDLVIERGDLWDLLELIGYNFEGAGSAPSGFFYKLFNKSLRVLQQANGLRSSQKNVAHHYDLSADLYRLFLDRDLQYSCAYFRTPSDTLEDAQRAKKEHIAAKLLLEPGMRVLDMGCGWGGMALFLAQVHKVHVHGVTLSKEQLAVARSRAKTLGLEDKVTFELCDYRNVEGPFDRIVSVGMFEHVGATNFDTFFETVGDLLTPEGIALVHSIGRMRGPWRTSGFLRRYIFPGGYIPALSEVMPSIEKSGLWLTDLEVLRLHYAETLRHWRERFLANADRLPSEYDERFRRMWEFYLAASEVSFRFAGFMVFQTQLSRSVNAVPLTRDYLPEREHMLAAAE